MFRVLPRALALVLSFLSLSTFAAEVWDGAPFASDPKALLAAAEAIKPQKPEEGVIILLDENVVRYDANGRATRVERLIFRVIDESAVDGWATIETSWQPWYHEHPQVDARVVTKDGAVHRLDPKSFGAGDAEDEQDMFSDTRILSGPIPAVAPGAVVEQTITYRDKNPLGDTGLTDRQRFGRWVETRQSRLVLEYPSTLEVKYVNKTEPRIEPQRTEENGVTRLLFETGPRPALERSEWYVPPDVSATSTVAWTTGKSWQTVAKRYSEIVDEKIGDLGSVAKVTAAAVGDAKETPEKIRRILAAIERDIRYAGVEFGEGSIFPRTPTETLRNKYGDCKDKATLLVAMLRQAGIPAHAVLINSGYGMDVEPDLPGLGHFNHVIVRTDGPDGIWIDPTDDFARAGEVPDSDQGRLVLIAKDDTTELVRTPLAESSVNKMIETREFFLSEDGKARVIEKNEYFGSYDRANRRYYNSTDAKSTGEQMKNYVESVYLSKNLIKWDKSDPRDLTKPFTLTIEAGDATRGSTSGGEAAVGIFWSRLTGDLPAELQQSTKDREEAEGKPRKYDFLFSRPYVLEVRYVLHPPIGYQPRDIPQPETLKLGTATVMRKYEVRNDGVVVATYTMDSGPRRITPSQFEETREAVVKLNEEKAFLFYFDQTGQKYLQEGEVGKAVAEFRRVADLHPKEGLHRADVARALLAGGLGAAARREAKRAVELEPKSARAHAILGSVLTNDLIGRPMHSGCDLPGAIAAYRKAKELDPKDISIRSELAFALEHSDDGERYADFARLDEAIKEYVAFKELEDAEKTSIDRELMSLYTFRSRWDDLKKLLAETTDTQAKDTYKIVLVGATEGGAAAVNAASQVPMAQRRDALAAAGAALMLVRQYPASADLFIAAAQGAPNAAQIRAQADVLRKAIRHEDMKLDPNDVTSLFKSVIIKILNDEFSEEELNKRYATADVADVFAGETANERRRRERREANGASVIKKMKKKGAQADVIADLGLSAFTFQKDGDENIGIRLRGRAPAGTKAPDFTAYLVRENGEFRFAATADSPAEFGLRALKLAEKNEVAAARQWLDWAREHVTGGGEDPVGTSPFAALWTRGKEATSDEIRIAAATLLPDTKKSAELALSVLEKARATASTDVQWRIDQSMLDAFQVLDRWEDSLVVADRLAEKFPESGRAFAASTLALTKLNREAEVRTRAKARLEKMPGDMTALQVLGTDALHHGAYDEAVKYYGQVLDRANATAGDYNDHAWAAVFAKGELETALEHAQHAAGQDPSYAILNTLAVVYAEQGKSSEARDTLLKSLEQLEEDELTPSDWYVVGRIAENYGITDAAVEAYKNIPKPKEPAGTTWALAQARLNQMK